MPDGASWVLIKGSGLAVQGPCHVLGIVFWADANSDYADIYDGLDATSGKKFCRIESATQITWPFVFPVGVHFASGVYVAGIDSAVETTVVFRQLEDV